MSKRFVFGAGEKVLSASPLVERRVDTGQSRNAVPAIAIGVSRRHRVSVSTFEKRRVSQLHLKGRQLTSGDLELTLEPVGRGRWDQKGNHPSRSFGEIRGPNVPQNDRSMAESSEWGPGGKSRQMEQRH